MSKKYKVYSAYREIGSLTTQINWLKKNLMKLDLTLKKEFLDKKNKELRLNLQCKLLNVNKSSLYYKKKPSMFPARSEIIQKIAEIYAELPFYRIRRTQQELLRQGYKVGRDKIGKIRKHLKLKTFYPAPKTTFKNNNHVTYQYLLKDIKIERVNQAWATDISVPQQAA